MILKSFLVFIGILLVSFSCAPSRFVKPLEKGSHAIQVHLGGPIAKVPGVGAIPLPLTSVGYGYGLKENLTLFGNVHPTAMMFGVGQLDIGSVWCPWRKESMGITLQPTLNLAMDFYTGAKRFWPQLDVNYFWDYARLRTKPSSSRGLQKSRTLYAGMSHWIDPYPTESQGRKNQQFWIPSLQLGHLWQRNQWVYQVELKALAPIYSNENIVVDYPSFLGNRGAAGLYFSVNYLIK